MTRHMKQQALRGTALLFFLTMQCYAVWFMQYNHPGPLGLGDATAYISNISFSRDFPLDILGSPDMDQVAWSWLFGVTARLLGLTPEAMFSANFYIGLVLMGLVLIVLFRKIDASSWFTCTGLALFALYEGNGAYHGFFWVVPSFYAIMLFLLGAAILLHSRHRLIFGFPVLIVLIMTHSTGIYLAALLVMALFLKELLFLKNTRAIKQALIILAGAGLLILSAQQFLQVSFIPTGKLTWQANQQLLAPIGEALSRYLFVRYFYGIYTPILAYGIYAAVRNRKYSLVSLLLSALLGYIALAPLVEYSYRLFYPLEILIWITMAYGISEALRGLAQKGSHKVRPEQAMHLAVMAFSVLFLYNALHQKVQHNYDYKFYHPRYFEQEAFAEHLKRHPGKKAAVYTSLPGHYQGLEGGWKNKQLVFRPSAESIAGNPSGWLVVGEQHRYYEADVSGFRITLPADASLTLQTPSFGPGRYRVELRDTGLQSARNIAVRQHGKTLRNWHEGLETIRLPDEEMYPPVMPPWYLYAEKTWPLYRNPIHTGTIVRKAPSFSLEFETTRALNSLELQNAGADTAALTGIIAITNLDTGKQLLLDLYWDDAQTLNSRLSMQLRGKRHPLLWADPEDPTDWPSMLQHPGKQYRFVLEKNFKDVKAFSIYTKAL